MPHISCTANDRAGLCISVRGMPVRGCHSAPRSTHCSARYSGTHPAKMRRPSSATLCAHPRSPAPHPHLYARLPSRPDRPAQHPPCDATRPTWGTAVHIPQREKFSLGGAVQLCSAVQRTGSAGLRLAPGVGGGACRPWPHRSGCPWRCPWSAVCPLSAGLRSAVWCRLFVPRRPSPYIRYAYCPIVCPVS